MSHYKSISIRSHRFGPSQPRVPSAVLAEQSPINRKRRSQPLELVMQAAPRFVLGLAGCDHEPVAILEFPHYLDGISFYSANCEKGRQNEHCFEVSLAGRAPDAF